MDPRALLAPLADQEPALASRIMGLLGSREIPEAQLVTLLERSLEGLDQERGFGEAFAQGLAALAGRVAPRRYRRYAQLVREAGQRGPAYGKVLARALAAAMSAQDTDLADPLLRTAETMLEVGVYTLARPMDGFVHLLGEGDRQSATVYLELLATIFSRQMHYDQALSFTKLIPRTVRALSPARRPFQLVQLLRVAAADLRLVEPMVAGLERGLELLSDTALERFVSHGLERFRGQPRSGRMFLGLESNVGRQTLAGLRCTVSLGQVRRRLQRYVSARTGRDIPVRPLFPPAGGVQGQGPWSVTDGRAIYLPEEMDRYPDAEENLRVYRCLARLEAGHIEWGTHAFDVEKALWDAPGQTHGTSRPIPDTGSDFERLFCCFEVPLLAQDIFTAVEHGRIRLLLVQRYPGLERDVYDLMRRSLPSGGERGCLCSAMAKLYAVLGAGVPLEETRCGSGQSRQTLARTCALFEQAMAGDRSVQTCARVLTAVYGDWHRLLEEAMGKTGQALKDIYRPLEIPFGRRIGWDPDLRTAGVEDPVVEHIRRRLRAKGLLVFRSDLRARLEEKKGRLCLADVRDLLRPASTDLQGPWGGPGEVDCSDVDLSEVLCTDPSYSVREPEEPPGSHVHWYPEWDAGLEDYLSDHCRVVERTLETAVSDFYFDTLMRHRALVQGIRKGFEWLRPQGLVTLRGWTEGDAFDYRALVEYAVDRRSRRMPSERLYLKRVKQQRDVAVLLLVDLSRSTAHTVAGGSATVLAVEKEAIVLFCEALSAVGDRFAVAGFSGAGRLRSDFLKIKDFEETMGPEVEGRIGSMVPQRNTRMGAAVRHGASLLQRVPSRVRLLILLGDGFPNDLDYKGEYAVEDTRKAIGEARAAGIHVHAVTVNLSEAARCDRLYGNVHHSLISDVRDLPHRLPRIYRRLTC